MFSGFFAFFTAYSIIMLIAYKVDPRFSLKNKKATSIEDLVSLSVVERMLLFLLLVVFSFIPALDVFASFGLATMFQNPPMEVLFGFFFGIVTFVLGMPIDALILIMRRRLSIPKTEREEKLARFVSVSRSRSKAQMVLKITVATFLIALLEEIIFRGYFIYYL